MADMPSNTPSSASAPVVSSSDRAVPTRAVSKTALMLAFAAGAAFTWIITQVVEDDDRAMGPNIVLVRPL